MSSPPKIYALMGPTAVGKTELALAIAEHRPVEIVSVDSAMIYRGLNIGTAKPNAEVRNRVPHHLIDICDPADTYSVGRFCKEAAVLVDEIRGRGCHPFFVGGTMMYFWSFFKGLSELPQQDLEVRKRLEAEAEELGWAALHARLLTVDPVVANAIHPHDQQRIQRALEVFELTGQPLSQLRAHTTQAFCDMNEAPVFMKLMPPTRIWLHAQIKKRFLMMLENGLVEEVAQLKAQPALHSDLPSLRCVGYRQIWRYLDDELSYADMTDRAIAATRQLAKRQCTWLQRWRAPVLTTGSPHLLESALSCLQEVVA